MATLQELKQASNDPRFQAFIGKKAIIGLYQFYEGDPIRRSQDFGEIVAIEDGMMVVQTQDERVRVPIRYEALIPAPRGQYTLKRTREEIVNPDFLISWRVDLADNPEESQWKANTAPHFASIVGKEWDFTYAYDRDYLQALIESRGADTIGKTVLAGISKYDSLENGDKQLVEQSQLYGTVVRLTYSEGVVIQLKDGSEFTLSPDISMLQSPPPAEYVLHSTQEVIVNPDLMTIWDIQL